MNLKEAVAIAKRHNEWRRGAEIEMVSQKELGLAIDRLIEHAEKTSNNGTTKEKRKA